MTEQTEQTEMTGTVTTNHNMPNLKEIWDKNRLLRLIVHISKKSLSEIVTHQGKKLTNKDLLQNLISLYNEIISRIIDMMHSPIGSIILSYINK